jgi:hypothetical protein
MKYTGPKVRVNCSVDGCRRGRGCPDDGNDWFFLCPDHWRRVPKWRRAALHRVERLRRKYGDTPKLNRRWSAIWRSLTRTATVAPPSGIMDFVNG